MKKIKFLSFFALLSVGALFLSNCGPGGDDPKPKPILNILADSTYLSGDASLAASTDFILAISASHTKKIKSIKLTKSVDGGVDVPLVDSAWNDKSVALFEYSGTTEATAGTEVYTWIVADKDGTSRSKTITITNIGDPGKNLITLEQDNDGNPIKVYNFKGPEKGAYGIGSGPWGIADPNSAKDIQDSTTTSESNSWQGRWTSRNGTTFKKLAVGPGKPDWNTIINDATITSAWEGGGDAVSVLEGVASGDLYLLNIRNSGEYALVLVTGVDKSVTRSEYVQFVYKYQDLL